MTGRAHTIQAAVVSAAASPYLAPAETAVLFLSIILIDIDHYIDFVVVCRRFSPRDMLKYHAWLFSQRNSVYGLNIFHTAECMGILFILGFRVGYLWVVLAGFVIHYLADLVYLYGHGMISARAFSIVEYLIRRNKLRRGYPVPGEGFWD